MEEGEAEKTTGDDEMLQYRIIIEFFERIEKFVKEQPDADGPAGEMQVGVKSSFYRAQESFAKFQRVTQYRVQSEGDGLTPDSVGCFVKSKKEYVEALKLLEDLSCCLELKVDFPLENALVDCI